MLFRFNWIFFLVLALVVAAVVHAIRNPSGPNGAVAPLPAATPAQQAAPASPPATQASQGAPNPASASSPPPAFDWQRFYALQADLESAKSKLTRALRHANAWQSEVVPLLASDTGRRLALDDQRVAQFAYLLRGNRATVEKLEESLREVEALLKVFSKLDGQAAPQPLEARTVAKISRLAELAEEASRSWSTATTGALALRSQARDAVVPDGTALADLPTLQTRLDEQQLSDAAERLARDEELRQQTDKIAQQAEEERALRAAQQERLAADAAAEKAEEAARQAKLDDEKRAELVERARSESVQQTLAPFITPRYQQPARSGGAVVFKSSAKKQPMSYSGLKQLGVFSADDGGLRGLINLAKIAGSRKLIAPKWSVNSQPANWNDADRKLLEEGQALLRELGPTLVELGMLSP